MNSTGRARNDLTSLFLDTGVLLGAVLPRDPCHERSSQVIQRVSEGEWRSVHTSDFVLTEAVNFLTRKRPHRDALEILLRLAFGAKDAPPVVTEVQHVHGGRFASSIDLLQHQFDRGLSLTDWTTVVLMRELDIRHLATFDRGFGGLVEAIEI